MDIRHWFLRLRWFVYFMFQRKISHANTTGTCLLLVSKKIMSVICCTIKCDVITIVAQWIVTSSPDRKPRNLGMWSMYENPLFGCHICGHHVVNHYSDAIMGTMASQITSLMIVYSAVYSGTYQRKHQGSASLSFVRGIHRWPVNSPHKGPVTRKKFHLMTSSWE